VVPRCGPGFAVGGDRPPEPARGTRSRRHRLPAGGITDVGVVGKRGPRTCPLGVRRQERVALSLSMAPLPGLNSTQQRADAESSQHLPPGRAGASRSHGPPRRASSPAAVPWGTGRSVPCSREDRAAERCPRPHEAEPPCSAPGLVHFGPQPIGAEGAGRRLGHRGVSTRGESGPQDSGLATLRVVVAPTS
jgi:hypothetical protein